MAHGTSETLRGAELGRSHAARGNEKKFSQIISFFICENLRNLRITA